MDAVRERERSLADSRLDCKKSELVDGDFIFLDAHLLPNPLRKILESVFGDGYP